MTRSVNEIKEVGLAISEAIAFSNSVAESEDTIVGLLEDLTHAETAALVVASCQVYVASAEREVTFRNWLKTVVDGALGVDVVTQDGQTSEATFSLLAVQVAAEMIFGA